MDSNEVSCLTKRSGRGTGIRRTCYGSTGPSASVSGDGDYLVINGKIYDFGSRPTWELSVTVSGTVEDTLENRERVVISTSDGTAKIYHASGKLKETGLLVEYLVETEPRESD